MLHRLDCQEMIIADQQLTEQKQLTELLERNDNIFAKHDFDIGQTQFSEYLKADLISPSNYSYATPIFAVHKKNGTLRIVTDYRKLNDITNTLDDIICYNPDFATHRTHLDNLFYRIRKASMKLQKSKCSFLCEKVK